MEPRPVFAISDLHLDFVAPRRRMDRLNPAWHLHPGALIERWQRVVPRNSVVLCPGDLSWNSGAGKLTEDYRVIDQMPGHTKILSPGNHDHGIWRSADRARRFCGKFDTLKALRGDALRVSQGDTAAGLVVAAAKGFYAPEDAFFGGPGGNPHDARQEMKRFQRELGRLKAALRHASEIRRDGDRVVVMIHYPPFANYTETSAFSAAIERADVDLCIFGHIHYPEEWKKVAIGRRNGVRYQLVASDYLNMRPLQIGTLGSGGFQLAELPEQKTAERADGLWPVGTI